MANQSSLSPKEQQTLFDLLKKTGQQPTSGGLSTDTPDLQAQQGTGNVDYSGMQQLFGQQQPPSPDIQQQDGDKMHPMDAIHQIGQQYGPTAPAGTSLATGPQIQAGPNGQLSASLPSSNPIMRLLGMKNNVAVNNPNYFDAIKKAGLDKYLPSGLAKMPDGTPFVGPETMQKVLEAKRIMAGQGAEIYSTLDQLTSQGLSEDEARKMLAANPNGVTSKEVGTLLSKGRLGAMQQMAEARSTMAGVAKMGQLLKVGGFDAAQEAAKKAVSNLGFAQRAQAAIDQVVAAGGIADQRQRADLATAIGGLVGNGASVITDERMKQFLPESAHGKFNNVVEYWMNERQPVDFTGFLPQLQDLVLREVDANKGISNGAQAIGIDTLALSDPRNAKALTNIRQNNSLVGNPVTPPVPVTPAASPVAPVVPPPAGAVQPSSKPASNPTSKPSKSLPGLVIH